MAPKGSPRMLIAASLLVTDKTLSVKGALSKAGFSAEEIAKEKKQRQARRRRDFLLKKKATTKIKGRRSMSTLPQTMSNAQKINYNNQQTKRDEKFMNNRYNHNEMIASKNDGRASSNEESASRMDALLFACSMQEPLSEPLKPTETSIPSALSTTSSHSASSESSASSFLTSDVSAASEDSMIPVPSVSSLPTSTELDNELNPIHFAPLEATSSEILDFNIFSSL